MGELLWEPPAGAWERSALGAFATWVRHRRGIPLDDYQELWQWSVDDLAGFWQAVAEFFQVLPGAAEPVVAWTDMADPTWFSGATVNYAEVMLRLPGRADDEVVVVARSQTRPAVELTAAQLRDQVARCRAGLLGLGVREGDRVAAYAPNVPETLVLLLASASIGAVFTSCAPEFGVSSVVDRWSQIEPTVLLSVDGYRYGTREIDRTTEVAAIRDALPSLRAVVHLPYLRPDGDVPTGTITWAELLRAHAPLVHQPLPFGHPLYVLFSSGTTGLPKPIVHGHGGIVLEHLKSLSLQMDLGAHDRFFWFSTTGWMMWNLLVSGLGAGATLVLFDGDPGHPDLGTLWRLAEETEVTYLGVSAPFLLACRKAGLHPRDVADLHRVRAVGSTGAPLPEEGFRWVYAELGGIELNSVSGGTDVCTGFLGGVPVLPVYAGEIPARYLGCRVESWSPTGEPLVGEVGELVVTAPMPSMPVGFWGDRDRSRYREAYFSTYPGVWRHGDWITITSHGGAVISGRSDATLNRGGVRLGTAEFYAVVESLEGVTDSVVVHLEDPEGGPGELLLFVVLAPDAALDEVAARIRAALRERLSPRHVPDRIEQVPGVPRTLSGKKLEVPVKRILLGVPVEQAAAEGALANPESLSHFVSLATGGSAV